MAKRIPFTQGEEVESARSSRLKISVRHSRRSFASRRAAACRDRTQQEPLNRRRLSMRFMTIVKSKETSTPPPQSLFDAIDKLARRRRRRA